MDLQQLEEWLKGQCHGLGTLVAYQELCLQNFQERSDEAAFRQLLVQAAARFQERYEGVPLYAATAKEAQEQLTKLTAAAATALKQSPEEQLRELNRLAVVVLG